MALQLGIFANTFKHSDITKVMDAVHKYHFASIEMNLSLLNVPKLKNTDTLALEPLSNSLSQHVIALTKARAIRMVSLAAYFNMIHPDLKQRNLGIEKLELLMQSAKDLGITTLALCSGTRDPTNMWRYNPDNESSSAYKDCLKSMTQALKLADSYDLNLAFEPEVNLVISSAQKARRFLDDLQHPRLKIIFDAANIFPKDTLPNMERMMTEAIYLLADEIVLVHAKDIIEDGNAGGVAAGKGKLDYKLYMSLVKDIKFTGAILLHGLAQDEVTGSLNYLKESLEA